MLHKSVLITGSNKGLGKALAIKFAMSGYDVIIHGRNVKDLEQSFKEVSKYGHQVSYVAGDLNHNTTIESLYYAASDQKLAVLVNNAATHCPHLPLEKVNKETTIETILTNLLSPILLTHKLYPLFQKQNGGTIININSIAGLEPKENRSIYCASKWGLRGFTETLRLEANKYNIKVMGVYPSRIKTKPEFDYGFEICDAAEKIFNSFIKGENDLLLDGRQS